MFKNQLCLVIFSFFFLKAFSQEFTDSSRTEYKNDAGEIGSKSGFFQTNNPLNYPTGATAWWHLLDVRHSYSGNNYAMQFAGSFFDQYLYFRKTNNNPSQQWSRVLMETAGKVGIGTIIPDTKIHLKGGHTSTQLRLTLPATENGGGDGDVSLQTWVSEPGYSWDGAGIGVNVTNDGSSSGNGFGRLNSNIGQSFIRFIPSPGAMELNTSSNDGTLYRATMYLRDGKIGIGTREPSTKLDISSGNNGSGDLLRFIGAASEPANYNLTFRKIETGKGNGQFPTYSYTFERSQSGGFNGTQLSLGWNGSIGIGTTNTEDSNYRLFVEKGIRTRKVKVDQLNWPDYVFHPSYNLPSLASLEAFIKTNSHLPDVPSAEDVESEGVDIGVTQATLLKKIEELTLYLIDQNKMILEQSKKIKVLQADIEKLGKREQNN